MAIDPYVLLRALLRAEAVRNAPKPQVKEAKEVKPQQPAEQPGH
ncbi:hypothetical protein [Streptomyces sp. NBC_00459]